MCQKLFKAPNVVWQDMDSCKEEERKDSLQSYTQLTEHGVL